MLKLFDPEAPDVDAELDQVAEACVAEGLTDQLTDLVTDTHRKDPSFIRLLLSRGCDMRGAVRCKVELIEAVMDRERGPGWRR